MGRVRKGVWKEKDAWNAKQPESERGKFRVHCEMDKETGVMRFHLTLANSVTNL